MPLVLGVARVAPASSSNADVWVPLTLHSQYPHDVFPMSSVALFEFRPCIRSHHVDTFTDPAPQGELRHGHTMTLSCCSARLCILLASVNHSLSPKSGTGSCLGAPGFESPIRCRLRCPLHASLSCLVSATVPCGLGLSLTTLAPWSVIRHYCSPFPAPAPLLLPRVSLACLVGVPQSRQITDRTHSANLSIGFTFFSSAPCLLCSAHYWPERNRFGVALAPSSCGRSSPTSFVARFLLPSATCFSLSHTFCCFHYLHPPVPFIRPPAVHPCSHLRVRVFALSCRFGLASELGPHALLPVRYCSPAPPCGACYGRPPAFSSGAHSVGCSLWRLCDLAWRFTIRLVIPMKHNYASLTAYLAFLVRLSYWSHQ